MTEQAEAFVDSLNLNYSAAFVPQSQSRNADKKEPSLNWRVTISNGRESLTTDYMQGCAHIPNYSHAFARLAVYDKAVREACETGKHSLIKRKNGYDACQANRAFPVKKALPAPALTDVLYCLIADADAIDYPDFEDWAISYGYDTDSRAAEKIYRACIDIGLRLRKIIPDLDAAREAFQDF